MFGLEEVLVYQGVFSFLEQKVIDIPVTYFAVDFGRIDDTLQLFVVMEEEKD